MLANLGFVMCLLLATVTNAFAFDDPSQAESDFYKAIKDRFDRDIGKPDPAKPGDPRIDITEILGVEGTAKKIATHDCPPGSNVQKVEIWVSFRLVHWDGKAPAGESGTFGLEKVASEVANGVKKLTYSYAVMFDVTSLQPQENDKLAKWQNAGLFYHEMLHGQLTLDRIKNQNWSGWETACKCHKPNLDFVGKGKHAADEEHLKIYPAQDEFFRQAVQAKENVTVVVVHGSVGANKERKFKKTIKIPDGLAEKDPLSETPYWDREIDGEPKVQIDREKGEITVEGKLKDDKDGDVTLVLDPPSVAALFTLRVRARPHKH